MNQDKIKQLKDLLELSNKPYFSVEAGAKMFAELAKFVKDLKVENNTRYSEIIAVADRIIQDHKSISKDADYAVNFFKNEISSLKNALAKIKETKIDRIIEKTEVIRETQTIDTDKIVSDASQEALQRTKELIKAIPAPLTGEGIILAINDNESELIKREKVEGLEEIERKADFALSRPLMMGGGGEVLQIKDGTNTTVTKVGGIYRINAQAGTGGGTVTSVAAITLGTTGTDLSSTVADGTTTPVITLQVPTASATNRGALSSADWSTFNGKQDALTFGIADTNKVQINAADVADNDYAKFTATGLEGRSYAEVLSDIGAQPAGSYAAALSGTINEIAYFNSASTIASLAVATYPSLTELSYVKGVTSGIQTQLNGKQASMGADDNYVTDAQLIVIGNTSGTNTGDNSANSLYSGLAASKADVGQTFYIGTTQVAINRASAALTLAGLTLTTPDIGTPSAGVLTNCTFPTLNQNTSGTAANLSGTPALPDGTTATTQAAADNSTKLATTAYADAAAAGGGATTTLNNLGTTAINTALLLGTSDAFALGSVTKQWSDLFLAEGGVINWDNGDATLTQVGDVLTLAGADLKITTHGTAATSVATIDGTQILTNKTIGGATPMSGYIDLDIPAADHTATGMTTNAILSGYTASAFDLVYLGTGGKWLEVDSNAVATCKGMIGIALEAKNDTEAMLVALPGSFVRDDTWAWTIGDTLYAGETLGAIQNTIPTGADAIIKVVGFAVSADVIFFNPSPDQQSTVA